MKYYNKIFKYKIKYLNIKKLLGGTYKTKMLLEEAKEEDRGHQDALDEKYGYTKNSHSSTSLKLPLFSDFAPAARSPWRTNGTSRRRESARTLDIKDFNISNDEYIQNKTNQHIVIDGENFSRSDSNHKQNVFTFLKKKNITFWIVYKSDKALQNVMECAGKNNFLDPNNKIIFKRIHVLKNHLGESLEGKNDLDDTVCLVLFYYLSIFVSKCILISGDSFQKVSRPSKVYFKLITQKQISRGVFEFEAITSRPQLYQFTMNKDFGKLPTRYYVDGTERHIFYYENDKTPFKADAATAVAAQNTTGGTRYTIKYTKSF